MTEQAWETLSNQAIAAAGIVYFLSLLAYLVQWASLRQRARGGRREGRGGGRGLLVPTRPTVRRRSGSRGGPS